MSSNKSRTESPAIDVETNGDEASGSRGKRTPKKTEKVNIGHSPTRKSKRSVGVKKAKASPKKGKATLKKVLAKKSNKKRAQSEESEGDDEYDVEKILGARIENGLEYYILWKNERTGKTYKEKTWEPAENCNCPEKIKAFEAELKKLSK